MMKHSVGIATGLASLLVLPAALGQQEVERLNEALSEISHAIDVMTGIDQALQEEPGRGIDLVLSATETPHLEQRGLDDRLGSLRKEVSLALQEAKDALRQGNVTEAGNLISNAISEAEKKRNIAKVMVKMPVM